MTEVHHKKKNWFVRHKVLTVLGVLIVIGIFASAGGGSNTTKTNQEPAPSTNAGSATTTEKKTENVAKLNEAARDGKFEFTVSGIECGKSTVGTNEYLTKQAQGQFCLLNVSVKNIGTEAQTLDGTNQFLYDAANARYSADSAAAIYANPQSSTFLNQINPGNSVTGVVVFDIPKDKVPTSAELHDSAFSGGIKVNLQ